MAAPDFIAWAKLGSRFAITAEMAQPEMMPLPGSEGPDAMVVELLSQLENTAPAALAGPTPKHGPNYQVEEAPKLQLPEPAKPLAIEIQVPPIDNPEDYEYLPGHFRVRRVMEIDSTDPNRPVYTIRLASGERITVSIIPQFRIGAPLESKTDVLA